MLKFCLQVGFGSGRSNPFCRNLQRFDKTLLQFQTIFLLQKVNNLTTRPPLLPCLCLPIQQLCKKINIQIWDTQWKTIPGGIYSKSFKKVQPKLLKARFRLQSERRELKDAKGVEQSRISQCMHSGFKQPIRMLKASTNLFWNTWVEDWVLPFLSIRNIGFNSICEVDSGAWQLMGDEGSYLPKW